MFVLITCRTHFSQPINHFMERKLLFSACVNNDILSAMDDGKITALVLLDLSAAFDTVDHKILLSRFQYHLGIHDIALDWCKSYLLNRPLHVCIGNAISKPVILEYSVPQGSVLGPQWFTVYTSPVRDIILKYNLNYHVYADDTQLYITFKSSQEPADSCITMLEKCIQEIRSWMRQNFLKLNDENTEFLLLDRVSNYQRFLFHLLQLVTRI